MSKAPRGKARGSRRSQHQSAVAYPPWFGAPHQLLSAQTRWVYRFTRPYAFAWFHLHSGVAACAVVVVSRQGGAQAGRYLAVPTPLRSPDTPGEEEEVSSLKRVSPGVALASGGIGRRRVSLGRNLHPRSTFALTAWAAVLGGKRNNAYLRPRSQGSTVKSLHLPGRARYMGLRQAHREKRFPGARAHTRSLPCSYCGGPGGTVDHIHPRSKVGRLWDTPANWSPACVPCNSQKH